MVVPTVWVGLGVGFQPYCGGGISTLRRFGVDTQEPPFLLLVNSTKMLPQIINSSPKSSAQVTAHGSLHSFGRLAQAIPPAGITRLAAKITSSRRSLCFIWPAKGTAISGEFMELHSELLQKGCTCITTGLKPEQD